MIQFIHVGKCAGTSISLALRKCGLDFNEHHCFDANLVLPTLLKSCNEHFYLLTVRDPVKRFISAFYWDYYEKRVINDYQGPNGIWKDLYEIFSTPNEVAEALNSDDSILKNAAENFIFNSKLHSEFTLSWYIRLDTVKQLNRENCHVVRTERADIDFAKFLEKMNLEISNFSGLVREKEDYKHELEKYDVSLTVLGLKNLKDAYLDDYMVLDELYRKGLIDERY
jgi:hypothetical protein